jgi:hypothetical protein
VHEKKKVFKYEPFIIAAVLFYGAFFWFGSKANYTKANTWFVRNPFDLFLFLNASRSFWTRSHHR